jgi:hypothetical protein
MIEAPECRERAKDCADHARTETNEKMRLVYSRMARSWATFADQIEREIQSNGRQPSSSSGRRCFLDLRCFNLTDRGKPMLAIVAIGGPRLSTAPAIRRLAR